jgi:hypothetical protein
MVEISIKKDQGNQKWLMPRRLFINIIQIKRKIISIFIIFFMKTFRKFKLRISKLKKE